MTKLYILCGIMGAGKSTYINNNLQDVVKVCPDDIRVELLVQRPEHKDKIEGELIDLLYVQEDRVWAIAKQRTISNLKNNKSVVFDATNLNRRARKQYFKWVEGMDVQVVAVFMDTSLEKALERNGNRGQAVTGYNAEGRPILGRMVPEDVIIQKFEQIMPPSKEEGFSEVIVIRSM